MIVTYAVKIADPHLSGVGGFLLCTTIIGAST